MISNNSPDIIRLRSEVRNEIIELKGGWAMTWEDWNEKVKEVVGSNSFTKFRHFTDHDKWGKLISTETIGASKPLQWWTDLKEIARIIKATGPTLSKSNVVTERRNSTTETIRYSVAKFQDTILPLLYKFVYTSILPVNFKPDYDWNKCLEAFKTGDIDVALHNFPTVLAYIKEMEAKSGMFFFPFFTFYGYAIFVRKSAIEKFANDNNLDSDFDSWRTSHKKKFFETTKILLERNTDVEWVFRKYIDKFDCDWSKIVSSGNIIECSINEGKSEFKRKSTIGVYCTNSIHITDLLKQSEKYVAISKGKDLTRHQNYNGLICTMEYFEQHPQIIGELISIWFNTIRNFKEEWDIISDTQDKDGFTNLHVDALLKKLNEYTQSSISLEELIDSYRKFNFFYDTPQEAFTAFVQNVLDKPSEIKNNIEISQIQAPGIPDIEHALIEKIKQQLQAAKKKMNL